MVFNVFVAILNVFGLILVCFVTIQLVLVYLGLIRSKDVCFDESCCVLK